jgi:spermidine/putrescine transport system substrate-binding protein
MARVDRRGFLRLAAAAAAIPLLDACTSTARQVARSPMPPATLLARRDHPIRWPVYGGNGAIHAGLPIERGATLKVYEWREYLSPYVIRSFEQKYRAYGVHVQTSSFENRNAAASRVAQPGSDLDVFFPTVDQLSDLIPAKVLRPLTHEYLPNLANLWPAFGAADAPFYDVGQGYTVPYTVFSSGIVYRRDIVRPQDSPEATPDPCAIFGNKRYAGRLGVLDSYREPLAMTLQAGGGTDLNTADPSALTAAANELIAYKKATGLKVTSDGDYVGIARGEFAAHQAWSGDVLSARRFGGAAPALTDKRLGYWWQYQGGVVGCDLLGVLSSARNPVLAHLFLNHLLDLDVAMHNFAWNGYQPPLRQATRGAFASPHWGRAVPENLLDDTILTPEQFDAGVMLLRLDPVANATWISQWQRFLSA